MPAGSSGLIGRLDVLVDDQAFLPLYFLTSKRVVSKRVSGWSDQNLTALRPARYLTVTP